MLGDEEGQKFKTKVYVHRVPIWHRARPAACVVVFGRQMPMPHSMLAVYTVRQPASLE